MRMLRSPPARLPTRLRLLPALLLPALLASAPLAAQQVYKWKDASGVTHFTSEPPPKGQQYETREVDHHQAVPAATDAGTAGDAAKPRAEDPGCATARNNLRLLAGEGTLSMDTDRSGKPKVLSDADRTRQRNLAQAIIDAKCGAAPAQAPEPEEQ
jgi:hypothetical protein